MVKFVTSQQWYNLIRSHGISNFRCKTKTNAMGCQGSLNPFSPTSSTYHKRPQKCIYQSTHKMQVLLVDLKPNWLIWVSLKSRSKGLSAVNDKKYPSHKWPKMSHAYNQYVNYLQIMLVHKLIQHSPTWIIIIKLYMLS